jgi:hypothetical protein
MQPMYYIGLDVHKRKISYCVEENGGSVYAEVWIFATRQVESSEWVTHPSQAPHP